MLQVYLAQSTLFLNFLNLKKQTNYIVSNKINIFIKPYFQYDYTRKFLMYKIIFNFYKFPINLRFRCIFGYVKKTVFTKNLRLLFFKFFFYKLKGNSFKQFLKVNKRSTDYHLINFFFKTTGFYLYNNKFL